jgi:hypothetical protein
VNCIEFRVVGSFQVTGIIAGLSPGAQVTLRIPVVNATGAPAGTRELACGTVDGTGRVRCNGFVGGPGEAPQTGGLVQVIVNNVAPPLLPPPPPIVLPPPPPPALIPLPPFSPVTAPFASAPPEVPIIPEADTALLLAGGLAAPGGWLASRKLRR